MGPGGRHYSHTLTDFYLLIHSFADFYHASDRYADLFPHSHPHLDLYLGRLRHRYPDGLLYPHSYSYPHGNPHGYHYSAANSDTHFDQHSWNFKGLPLLVIHGLYQRLEPVGRFRLGHGLYLLHW